MDFQKIAALCRKLNSEYGFMQAVFVAGFILSIASIYFFIISPLLSIIFDDQLAGFLQFALLILFMVAGKPLIKNEHYESVFKFLYAQPKMLLTLGIIIAFALLKIKPLIFQQFNSNGNKTSR